MGKNPKSMFLISRKHYFTLLWVVQLISLMGSMLIAIKRLRVIEAPRGMGLDQELLRELRTNQPEMETAPAAA